MGSRVDRGRPTSTKVGVQNDLLSTLQLVTRVNAFGSSAFSTFGISANKQSSWKSLERMTSFCE